MLDRLTRDDLVQLLAWYGEAGVDCAVGDEPFDWFQRAARPPGAGFAWPLTEAAASSASGSVSGSSAAATAPRRRAAAAAYRGAEPAPSPRAPLATVLPPASTPQRPRTALPAALPDATRAPPARFATAPPDAALIDAQRIAASATDLAALAAALQRFDGCALKATAKSTCVWRGAEKARLMIIGEAPGRDEDIEGRPFVGRAGQLLDRMLAAIGFGEDDVHITNVVYWRPPGNRTPTAQETLVCRPFLERQIALVEPEVLLLVGGAAAKAMLDTEDGIMKLRGKWREIETGGIKRRAIATLHPAYLLRTPAAKRMAWRDLLSLKVDMQELRSEK
ncbi:MAG: uracil-DNA glycosylase [Hyphomicrobiaceae bacterium]